MLPLTLSIYALGTPLSYLYTSNPVAIKASVLVTLFFTFRDSYDNGGRSFIQLSGKVLGNARLPFYATSIGMWCIRIGTGCLMGIVLGWGLPGIWAGTLLDNGFRWMFLRYRYKTYMTLKG